LHLLLPAGFYRRFLCVCLRLIFHINMTPIMQWECFIHQLFWRRS
jgi:hypothetical protein